MIELGNLEPLHALAESLAEWEAQVRARPLPDSDPVAHALATVRQQLGRALEKAAQVEMELTAAQYAQLRGWSLDALYKKWQRKQLPEAHMRGGKLVVPLSAAITDAAA